MGCYTIPLIAAILHKVMGKKFPEYNTKDHSKLNLLLMGGGLFGVVDHLWNNQLLSFTFADIMLGFMITIVIMTAWLVMTKLEVSLAKETA
ncbi:hypothetical protein HQ529_05185 [Candidatus Woesearchaeota archaeon]|nr:hypothetical protein [Candidatus Woesearchaeota archaeon]